MSLLCPKYIAAMDAAGMDDMAEYAEKLRQQTQPEEQKGGAE
jgi:hypothetical protein